ncbi:MAG: hypothetical protein IKN12_04260 [Selenomonadaceae bacterium]|nr:hypothetical protein [Selenomonadaceae bacterium]
MRAVRFALIAMVLMMSCAAGYANPRVAVLPPANKNPLPTGLDATVDFSSLLDIVTDAMGNPRLRFEPYERGELEALITEQHLSHTALFDQNTAAKFGKLIGAEYVMITNITGLSKHEGKIVVRMYGRVVDVETGRIAWTGRGLGIARDLSEAFERAADDMVAGRKGLLERMKGLERYEKG